MAHTVKEIAAALGAEAFGAVDLVISGAAEPAAAGPEDLALAMSPRYADQLAKGQARAAVLWPGADWQALGLQAAITAPRARLAMARLTAMLDDAPLASGVHPTAIVEGAILGEGVGIGPFAVIGAGAKIGAGTQIGAHVSIAPGAEIGPDCLINDGARIRRKVYIGARVIIHCNAVIGDDGFSFVTAEVSNVEKARLELASQASTQTGDPTWHRIHSLGGVKIGDDVEIGSNTTIDAGTIRATIIGDGCKIDNICQIGHNVVLGRHCLIAGNSGIAGSAVLGDRVVMGGKAGIGDNIKIGDDAVITGGTKVMSNVPARRVMMGYPAVEIEKHVEMYKAMRRLPRFLREMMRQKAVSKPDETP